MKIGVPLSGSGYPLIRSAPVRPRQGRDVGCAATPGVPSVNPGLPASNPPGSSPRERPMRNRSSTLIVADGKSHRKTIPAL